MFEFPAFHFELWHLPLVFLAGLIGEFYGSIIGGGSIALQGMMVLLGLPIQNAIAIDNASVLGTEFGMLKETKEEIKRCWKLALFVFFPTFLGGVLGTYFLLNLSPIVIKNIVVIVMLFLLAYWGVLHKKKIEVSNKKITFFRYFVFALFLFLIGVYNNFIGIAEGTFFRIVIMSLLGLTFIDTLGLKTIAILPIRIYSLIITCMNGLIFFPYFITLFIATFIAGICGVRCARRIPERYLQRALVTVSLFYLGYLIFFY